MKGNVNSRRGLRPDSGRPGRHAAKSRISRVLALFSAVAISGGLAVALAPAASADSSSETVSFCHRTSSSTDPYNDHIEQDINSLNGHTDFNKVDGTYTVKGSHQGPVWSPGATIWGDIIAPNSWLPRGYNWYVGDSGTEPNVAGQAILTHGCSVSATVTLTKAWDDANPGDTVTVTIGTGKSGSKSATATAPKGPKSSASISVGIDDIVTLSEQFTKGDSSDYTSNLSCDGIDLTGDQFTVTGDMIGTTIACTFTNALILGEPTDPGDETPPTTVTVTKMWVINNNDAVADTDDDGMQPGSLSVNGSDVIWGDPIAWTSEDVPTVNEGKDVSITKPGCSPAETAPNVDYPEALATGQSNVITVTNYVTCEDSDNPGGDTPGGNPGTPPPPPITPSDTTPQIEVLPSNNVEAVTPPQVLGVSQELPPAPVIKVKPAAHIAPAPSANAHTGQGQSPWVYLLFGAGALLMLGAWRVRRNGNA